MQSILSNDVVVVPLLTRANIEVVRATLQNHKITNSEVSSFWNIAQWYFK